MLALSSPCRFPVVPTGSRKGVVLENVNSPACAGVQEMDLRVAGQLHGVAQEEFLPRAWATRLPVMGPPGVPASGRLITFGVEWRFGRFRPGTAVASVLEMACRSLANAGTAHRRCRVALRLVGTVIRRPRLRRPWLSARGGSAHEAAPTACRWQSHHRFSAMTSGGCGPGRDWISLNSSVVMSRRLCRMAAALRQQSFASSCLSRSCKARPRPHRCSACQ